jgi:hypothetical protein
VEGENDRPQDVGRRHRRKAAPGAATTALLDRYQEALRAELAWILDVLKPQDGLVGTAVREGSVAERTRRWDLAMKIARELGGEIDPGPDPGAADPLGDTRPPARRGKVDYGGA